MIENACQTIRRQALKTTPLDAWHRALGARMVPFAGYAMPVQYDPARRCWPSTCTAARKAALFDVSHMGQATLHGAGAAAALERLVPGDIARPEAGPAALHAADQRGGRHPRRPDGRQSRRRAAVPGGQRQPQGRSISPISPPHLPAGVQLQPHDDRALLALQGPAAAAVMGRSRPAAAQLPFMGVARRRRSPASPAWSPAPATPARTGSRSPSPPSAPKRLAHRAAGPSRRWCRRPRRARLAAAGSRALPLRQRHRRNRPRRSRPASTWAIGKRRRSGLGFSRRRGRSATSSTTARRAAASASARTAARRRARGTDIVAADGTEAGTITSGGFAPTLNAPIAMGYVPHAISPPTAPQLHADGARQAAARPRRAAAVRPPPLRPLKGASQWPKPLRYPLHQGS